jgi:hypothetical protein
MELESATLMCVKCGEHFGQHEWNRGEEFLRWRFDQPDHESTFGFRMNGLNSPWLRWSDLAGEYRQAKRIAEMGDESLLRVFFNTRLARSYRVLGKAIELDLYHDRREVYSCHRLGAEIPEGVLLLTAAVDVQDRSLAYEVGAGEPIVNPGASRAGNSQATSAIHQAESGIRSTGSSSGASSGTPTKSLSGCGSSSSTPAGTTRPRSTATPRPGSPAASPSKDTGAPGVP